jgi:hypothetical protein
MSSVIFCKFVDVSRTAEKCTFLMTFGIQSKTLMYSYLVYISVQNHNFACCFMWV